MAARRLIAVMIVLLVMSSAAAALVPVTPREETTSSTREQQPEQQRSTGSLVVASLDAQTRRPAPIRAQAGDQLQLRVSAPVVETVQLRGIGATEDVDPDAPARFDVTLREPGTYPVRLLFSGRQVGVIRVSPRRSAARADR